MTAYLTRSRVLLLVLAATLLTGGVVTLNHQRNASAVQAAAPRATTTTSTTVPPTTTSTTVAPATTTTSAPKPKAPTTTSTTWPPRPTGLEQPPIVTGCTWSAHIVAGGLGSGAYAYDQFVVDMTNPAWVGMQGYFKTTTTKPATTAVPYNSQAEIPASTTGNQPFDANGHRELVYAVNPSMQGGVFSIQPTATVEHDDYVAPVGRCDAHAFTVDYNGAEGLPGGTAASQASPNKSLGQ